MAANAVCISSEFDIFATRPVQMSTVGTTEIAYKTIAFIDQSHLEFLVPADNDTYADLNVQLYFRGKLVDADGAELEVSNHMAVTNNFLHSVFSQCNISLNGVTITPSSDNYQYRAYLETLLT
jgi:hypothetical protein